MRKHITLRNFVLAAVALLAIGAIGYAAGGGSSTDDEAVNSAGSIGAAGGAGLADLGKTEEARSVAPVAPAREGESTAGTQSGPGSAPLPADGAVSIDRKIVSTASIQLQVENVGSSFEEVGRIATTAGGFIASSSFTYQGEDQLASVTLRVPSESYQSVLASLRKLGAKVDYENSDAQDVTEEYTDLGARIRTLEATESQLLTLLAKAETITDILTVQDRLNFTRTEIEQVKGRMQLLDNLTSLATITVHLRPVVAGAGDEAGDGVDLGHEVSEAWDNSIEFLGEIAAGVVTVVVFAWWLPIVGLPLFLGYRAVTRGRPRTAGAEMD